MNKTLPEGHFGITELEELEKNIDAALALPRVKYAMPPRVAMQLVQTAKVALKDAGRAVANYISDEDFIVDLSWRLKNMRRALRAATKVRIPNRLAKEPAVLRLRAIAKRALEWDDDAEREMVAEFGEGLERVRPNDSIEDVDREVPEVGHEFSDALGNRYVVTSIDDEDEFFVEVELVEPVTAIDLETFLTHAQLTPEQREARLRERRDDDA